jgi:multimeric flavodoxin WrbA
MIEVTVVNGSPRMEKGNTSFLLAPFLEGMKKAGANIQQVYASRMKIQPCSCGPMYCWSRTPSVCIHKDEMSILLQSLKLSDILIFATPVYTPLPGAMQEFINRLCPLLDPRLRFENGRSKAQFRDDVRIRKIGLVVASGWWEKENTDNVVKIVKDLASLAGCEFLPPILRPQADNFRSRIGKDDIASDIMRSLETAGEQLIQTGTIDPVITDSISQPLMSLEEFLASWN